jgi:hypothetical protein
LKNILNRDIRPNGVRKKSRMSSIEGPFREPMIKPKGSRGAITDIDISDRPICYNRRGSYWREYQRQQHREESNSSREPDHERRAY